MKIWSGLGLRGSLTLNPLANSTLVFSFHRNTHRILSHKYLEDISTETPPLHHRVYASCIIPKVVTNLQKSSDTCVNTLLIIKTRKQSKAYEELISASRIWGMEKCNIWHNDWPEEVQNVLCLHSQEIKVHRLYLWAACKGGILIFQPQ